MAGFISLLKSTTPLLRPGLIAQGLVAGANVISIAYYLKHTVCVKYYRNFTERIGVYGPDEPAKELHDILTDVISNDLKDQASENTSLALYLTSGMETSHLGTIGTLAGGFVGLPVFFEFKTEDDVFENFTIRNVNNHIENDETKEKESINCFVLSNNAKRYGIAREALLVNTYQVYVHGILPFAASLFTAFMYKEMYQTYHLFKKPLYIRCVIYTVLILGGLSVWRFLYKQVLHYYESEVEAAIAQLGSDYIKGGIEYCTKEIERSSLSVESKNVKFNFFKAVDDFLCIFLPKSIPPETRLQYLKTFQEKNKPTQE